MPSADRGSVWIVDLGMAAKVRPALVLSVPTDPVLSHALLHQFEP